MIKKIVCFVFVLSLGVMPSFLSSSNRKVIALRIFPDTTVGDLFTTMKRGFLGFNLPLSPEFTKRGWFSAIPEGMESYKAFYKMPAGIITTASMNRFIKQGHMLFDDAALRKAYEAKIKECVLAHKTWFFTKKAEDLVKLHEASEKVREMLNTLQLSNPMIRLSLQRILSSSKKSLFDTTWNKIVLSKRSSIKTVFGKAEGVMKTIVKPSLSWRTTSVLIQALKILTTSSLLGLGAHQLNEFSGKFVFFASGFSMLYSCYSGWKNDYSLTAEPENGIKVRFIFDEGESCDNSGSFSF